MSQSYSVTIYPNRTVWRKPNTYISHRLDGPAVEYSNGDKEWWVNGKLHRLDGPALEYKDGTKYWWVEDKCLSEAEFLALTQPKAAPATCDGKTVEIDGKKYVLKAL